MSRNRLGFSDSCYRETNTDVAFHLFRERGMTVARKSKIDSSTVKWIASSVIAYVVLCVGTSFHIIRSFSFSPQDKAYLIFNAWAFIGAIFYYIIRRVISHGKGITVCPHNPGSPDDPPCPFFSIVCRRLWVLMENVTFHVQEFGSLTSRYITDSSDIILTALTADMKEPRKNLDYNIDQIKDLLNPPDSPFAGLDGKFSGIEGYKDIHMAFSSFCTLVDRQEDKDGEKRRNLLKEMNDGADKFKSEVQDLSASLSRKD